MSEWYRQGHNAHVRSGQLTSFKMVWLVEEQTNVPKKNDQTVKTHSEFPCDSIKTNMDGVFKI